MLDDKVVRAKLTFIREVIEGREPAVVDESELREELSQYGSKGKQASTRSGKKQGWTQKEKSQRLSEQPMRVDAPSQPPRESSGSSIDSSDACKRAAESSSESEDEERTFDYFEEQDGNLIYFV